MVLLNSIPGPMHITKAEVATTVPADGNFHDEMILFLYVPVVCHTFPSIERIFFSQMAAPSREVSGHLQKWYGWCTL